MLLLKACKSCVARTKLRQYEACLMATCNHTSAVQYHSDMSYNAVEQYAHMQGYHQACSVIACTDTNQIHGLMHLLTASLTRAT